MANNTNNAPAFVIPGRVTYQTVALAFLSQGVDAARAQLDAPQCARPHDVALKACVQLSAMGSTSHAELDALAREFAPATSGLGRGAISLANAGSKVYKAQQVGDGDVWIRVPVSALGADRGDKLEVTFQGDAINIKKL